MSGTKYNSKKDNVLGKGTPVKTPITRDPKLYAGTLVYGDDGNLYFSNGEEWRTTSEDLIRKPVAVEPKTPREQAILTLTKFSAAQNSGLHQTGVEFEVYNTLEEFTNNTRTITGATWANNKAIITCNKNHNLEANSWYIADIKDVKSSENPLGTNPTSGSEGYNIFGVPVKTETSNTLSYTLNTDPGTYIQSYKNSITLKPKNKYENFLRPLPADAGATGYQQDLGLDFFIQVGATGFSWRENQGANSDFWWRGRYSGDVTGSDNVGQVSRWSDIFRQTFPKLIETPVILNKNTADGSIHWEYRTDLGELISSITVSEFESAFESEGVYVTSALWYLATSESDLDVEENRIEIPIANEEGDDNRYRYLYVRDFIDEYGLEPDQTYFCKVKYFGSIGGGSPIQSEWSSVRKFVVPDIYSIVLHYDVSSFVGGTTIGFTFKLQPSEGATIYWGTDTVETVDPSSSYITKTHTAVGSDYKVRISGKFKSFGPENPTDKTSVHYTSNEYLSSVTSFGLEDSPLESLKGALVNTQNIVSGTGLPKVLPANINDLSYMFYNSNLVNSQGIGSWNTPNVTNMSYMFFGSKFNDNIGAWDVSKVTDFTSMFNGANNFDNGSSPLDWTINTDEVNDINMSYMFRRSRFNQDISGWNVSRVSDMSHMFEGCQYFDQDIGDWTVSNVRNMSYMFAGVIISPVSNIRSVFNRDIGDWIVSNVENMSFMFFLSNFDQNISSWNVERVTSMQSMFSRSLYNKPLSWTGNNIVTDLTSMFNLATKFNSNFTIKLPDNDEVTALAMFTGTLGFTGNPIIDIRNSSSLVSTKMMFFNSYFNGTLKDSLNSDIFNTSNVQDMTSMFERAIYFNQDISSWGFSQATTLNSMFRFATEFNNNGQPLDDMEFCQSSDVDMSKMFENATKLTVSLNNWNVSRVTNFSRMFYNALIFNNNDGTGMYWTLCQDPTKSINMSSMFESATKFNQQLVAPTEYPNAWKTGRVTNMSNMFKNSGFLHSGGEISSLDTSNVTDMSYMFAGTQFNKPIGQWDVSKVTNMSAMFKNNTKFNNYASPNLKDWDVSKVTNMSAMFDGATRFNKDLGDWNTKSVTDMSFMFQGATKFNQDLSGWDTSNVTTIARMFNGASLFTNNGVSLNTDGDKWNVSKVTSMDYTFAGTKYNSSLADWNVSKVTNFNGMFRGSLFNHASIDNWKLNVNDNIKCSQMFYLSSFNQPLSSWNTGKIDNMSLMFAGCSFNRDISGWNTQSVTDMNGMFEGNNQFNQDISEWNVLNVSNTSEMFADCSAFNYSLGNWTLAKLSVADNMFDRATAFAVSNYANTVVAWAAKASSLSSPNSGLRIGVVGMPQTPQISNAETLLKNQNKWNFIR